MIDVVHHFRQYVAAKGAPAAEMKILQHTPADHAPEPGEGGFWIVAKGALCIVFVEHEAMKPEQVIAIFDHLCECEATNEARATLTRWCKTNGYELKVGP